MRYQKRAMEAKGILLSLLTSLIVPHTVLSEACGPDKLCTCSNITNKVESFKVDCSKAGVNIWEVCHYIAEIKSKGTIELDASHTNSTYINQSIIQGCKSVSTLSLSRNRISFLSKDAFVDFDNLVQLDLSSNELSSIYQATETPFFINMPKLKYLHINGNVKIQPGMNYSYPDTSNLQSLQLLSMDGLYNTEFQQSYSSLTKFHTLYLSGSAGKCNLGHLTNNTFKILKTLRCLDISACNISNIDGGTFKPLEKLRWLDLSLNRRLSFRTLRNISYGLQFTEIDFLNFSSVHKTFGVGTKLLNSDICFLKNTTLREFSISANRLELVERNLLILLPHTMQVLHVEENRFTFGQYLLQMGCVPNLTSVNANRQNTMHDPHEFYKENFEAASVTPSSAIDCPFMTEKYLLNESSRIPDCNYAGSEPIPLKSARFPPNIKQIFFSDCNLKYDIPNVPIVPLKNSLKHIDLSGNTLPSWIGPVGPLPALKSLNLSRNYCSHIADDFFVYAVNLEILDIRSNFIGIPLRHDTTGSIFKYLKNLKQLHLSTNQIKYLPTMVFQNLQNLEYLDLSNNIIDEITFSVDNLKNLSILNLRNNALQSLPDKLVKHLKALQENGYNFSIDLLNNPIRTACGERAFLEWMVKHRHNFKHFEDYNFVNVDGGTLSLEQFLSHVSRFDKVCPSYTVVIVICTLMFAVFLSLVIGGVLYKNRWKLRYLLYMNKKRFYGYVRIEDQEPVENYKYDAFISYSEDDIGFILQEIIPILEENNGLNLCIHQRDFLPGNAISDNIIDAIQSSRKTVTILSKTFVKRKWCLYEFHMARMEDIYSRNEDGCLVVVMLEGVPGKDMSLEMVQWIKEKSYIEFTQNEDGNQLFWKNLTDAIKGHNN